MEFRPRTPSVRPLPLGLILVTALGMAGCEVIRPSDSALALITPYKIEVVQGNVITDEQAKMVKAGMTRPQVRDVLGTALLADPFHADRWDYVFTIRRQGAERQIRRVVVRFDGDIFKSIDTGGDLPTEREFVASIDTYQPWRSAPLLELTPEQVKALPAPARPATIEAEPVGPIRVYPPLEPRS